MWPFSRRRRWYPPVLRALGAALGLYLVARLFARLVAREHHRASPSPQRRT